MLLGLQPSNPATCQGDANGAGSALRKPSRCYVLLHSYTLRSRNLLAVFISMRKLDMQFLKVHPGCLQSEGSNEQEIVLFPCFPLVLGASRRSLSSSEVVVFIFEASGRTFPVPRSRV